MMRKSMKKRMVYLTVDYFYFPLLILYMEIVFHLYMGLSMKYVLIFGGFSVAAGLFIEGVTGLMAYRAQRIARSILSFLISVLFCVEMICKDILQQYYQLFSAMDTAAGNHLEDYRAAVFASMGKNWFGFLLLLVLPGAACAVTFFWMKRNRHKHKENRKEQVRRRRKALMLVSGTVLLHVLLLLLVNFFPWKGDFTPKVLYGTDTFTEDQVEQLGVVTMLRLDCKHSIFGVSDKAKLSQGELKELAEYENEAAKKDKDKKEEIDDSPNVMELDLKKSMSDVPNDDVRWMSEYFQAVSPTRKNEYTGKFKDFNVIFITAEGFTGYLIDEKLTPTLYRLTHEGFVFKNFYSALHFTSTSGGEFQNLTGLYPKNGFPISMTETGKKKTYLPFTLANVLNEKGYTSTGYHYNENMYGRELSHPNLGYDWRQVSECKNPIEKERSESGYKYWPQSDVYMVENSIQDYIGKEPFNIYYLTLSGHLPYGYVSNEMSKRNRELVEALPYSEKTRAYLAANLELEKGLTRLVSELETAGIADKTVIVMAPDHIPYSDLDVIAELAGKSFGVKTLENLDEKTLDFDVYKNSLIMWSAAIKEPVEVEKPCCQVDILPTVLNLLGAEYDSRLLGGTDILSDSEPLVVFTSRSWLTDKGIYNRYTGEFTPAKGVTMSEEETEKYVKRIKTLASCRMGMTDILIENNYYKLLFGK